MLGNPLKKSNSMTSMFMDVKYSFSTDASIGMPAMKDPGTEKLGRPMLGNVVPALFQEPIWASGLVASKLGKAFSKCLIKTGAG